MISLRASSHCDLAECALAEGALARISIRRRGRPVELATNICSDRLQARIVHNFHPNKSQPLYQKPISFGYVARCTVPQDSPCQVGDVRLVFGKRQEGDGSLLSLALG